MKLKLTQILVLTGCILALLYIIQACRKTDWRSKDHNIFDVKNAKEWWYGNFRKSAEYSEVDHNSPFVPKSNSNKESNKKYPSWKRGISYSLGKLQVAELPLIYNSPVVVFPGSGLLNKEEKIRIAKATINKLLLFKMPAGNTVVRTVTLVPSPEYAKGKNYDISDNTLRKPDPDFDGWFIIKDWKETLISYWKIENGKRVKKILIEKKQTLARQPDEEQITTEQELCVPTLVEGTGRLCVGDVINADEPGEPDECTDWYEYTVWELEFRCDEIGGPGEDDPMDVCLSMGLTNEQCSCFLYALGCEEQGGGAITVVTPIIANNVDNPCIKNSVDAALSLDCKNEITNFINSVFGSSETYHIQFNDLDFVGADVDTDALTTTGPMQPDYTKTMTNIRLNNLTLNNSSREYIAATVLHEAIHAWIDFKFPNPVDNAAQHNLMASTNRFNLMREALLEMYPGLSAQDATDLTWGGMYATFAFNNLSQTEKDRIMQTNSNYRNRTGGKGTPC